MQVTPLIHLPEIEFMKLSDKAVIPHRAHTTDAGLDLYTVGIVSIAPHSSITIPTDLAINLPSGFEAQIRPRSGVTSKTKLRVQLGTIDSGYQGNIGIMVDNIGDETIILQEAYKLAQLVIAPIVTPQVKMVSEFVDDTERGSNGFGSSGV
nr:dUTP diphosphatase [Macrococcus goetzii]